MDIFEALLVLGVGLLAGGINTIAGGGSLISLPILIFLGLPPIVANATNRVAIFAQGISAVAGFKSKGVSEYKYSLLLGCSALIGAIIGAKIAVDIHGDIFNRILAVVMITVVAITVTGLAKPKSITSEKTNPFSKVVGTITFFFIGIYGGFIQAGVGFLIIGSLSSIHGFGLVRINSIKVFVIIIYTMAALAVFIYEEKVNWPYGIILAVGNSTGAWFASRWSVDKGDKLVKIFLVITVVGLAIKLWLF